MTRFTEKQRVRQHLTTKNCLPRMNHWVLRDKLKIVLEGKPQWTLQVTIHTHSCYPQIYISVNPATVLRNARSRTKQLASILSRSLRDRILSIPPRLHFGGILPILVKVAHIYISVKPATVLK